jgi:hypothetical protein
MLDTRAEVLKESLLEFYKKKKNFDIFNEIISERTSKFSLRVIEWFCNNFSRKYDISYKTTRNKDFNVYLAYKSQLDSYSKKQFDPFNRKHKGFPPFVILHGEKKVETTVGQMNFFKWCINNNVLEYIEKYLENIKQDMALTNNIRNNSSKNPKQPNTDSRLDPIFAHSASAPNIRTQVIKQNSKSKIVSNQENAAKRKKTHTTKQNTTLRKDTKKLLVF